MESRIVGFSGSVLLTICGTSIGHDTIVSVFFGLAGFIFVAGAIEIGANK